MALKQLVLKKPTGTTARANAGALSPKVGEGRRYRDMRRQSRVGMHGSVFVGTGGGPAMVGREQMLEGRENPLGHRIVEALEESDEKADQAHQRSRRHYLLSDLRPRRRLPRGWGNPKSPAAY